MKLGEMTLQSENGQSYYTPILNHFNFCPVCGQKIDWGGEDER